jgi:hypothetical protein
MSTGLLSAGAIRTGDIDSVAVAMFGRENKQAKNKKKIQEIPSFLEKTKTCGRT